ncbi:MAG: flagellar basal body P-ring protein FlgI, partial [Pseudomonadota bacterium]
MAQTSPQNAANLASLVWRVLCRIPLAASLILAAAVHSAAEPIRLKDLVEFDGVRGNDLVGYGLVVGLNGTGDGLRNSPYT